MGGQDGGLTLQGLAQRLETLEHENERMISENAALRDEVATLRSSGAQRAGEPAVETSGFDERVSRRSLLGKAGAAAAGLVLAGALTQRDIREAEAAITESSHNANVAGVTGINHAGGAGVKGEAGFNGSAFRGAVEGENRDPNGYGVWGNSSGVGVRGNGNTIGVTGRGKIGVSGQSTEKDFAAVYGQHFGENGGYGVRGDGNGAGYAGVLGRNRDGGTGVRGEGGTGVRGDSPNGTGVWGDSPNGTGVRGNSPNGRGVHGVGIVGVEGFATGANSAGVSGISNKGYGGHFSGGKAQLRLGTGSGTGKPTTGAHSVGEIYMDSTGTLFVCTAGGTPGTWRRVTTTAT